MRSTTARTADAVVPEQGRWRWYGVALVLALGLGGAMAISELVERRVVAPACRAYATDHGLAFTGIDVYGLRQEQPGPHCLFTDAAGSESTVWLQRLVPFFTDLWVGSVMDIELSAPALCVAIALLWTGLDRRFAARRPEGP